MPLIRALLGMDTATCLRILCIESRFLGSCSARADDRYELRSIDQLLAQRGAQNMFDIDSLLAYSAVCGTGLDTIPVPGDVSRKQLATIFGDVAALAWKWHKP